MNYPGWVPLEDAQKFDEDSNYNSSNWTRLLVIKETLSRIYPRNEEEKQLRKEIADAVDNYCLVADANNEIFAGCYGVDIWEENPITQAQKQCKTEVSWVDIEEEIRELHRKDPSKLYWTRPHDPRKKSGLVVWLKSIFKHNNLD
jgi:hypothetical protein